MRFKQRFYACTVGLLALALSVSGCGSSSQGGDAKKPAGVPQQPRAKSPIEALPLTANLALGINVSRLRSSALFKELLPLLTQRMGAELKEFKDLCGVELFEAVDSIVLSTNTRGSGDDMTVVVSGMERDQFNRCAPAVAEAQGQTIQLAHEGDYTRMIMQGSETSTWLGWISGEMFVMRTGQDKSIVEPHVRGEQSLTGNTVMMELMGKVSTEGSLWLITGGTDMDPNIVSIHATADTTGGLKLDAGLETISPDTATSMAQALQDQITSARQMMKSVDKFLAKVQISATDKNLFINLDLTEPEVIELVRTLLNDALIQSLIGT